MRTALSVLALTVAVLGAVPSPGSAQESRSLEDFAWLEGRWIGELDVGDGLARAELQYFDPRGGALTGSFRLTRDGRTLVVELFSLLEVEGVLEMRLRHFDTALSPWEGETPVVLRLESASDTLFTFRNPVNDSPRLSSLQYIDPDRFRAWSEIYDAEGRVSRIDITYRRYGSDSR